MYRGLRVLCVLDAAVLLLLGGLLIFAPAAAARLFQFDALPETVHYLVGLWGCALVTMAFGYVAAAQNPLRHRVWIQVGIARGSLECLLGVQYLLHGTLTVGQALPGLVAAGALTAGYTLLYPRPKPDGGTEEART